jgi:hypothetical protein
MTALRKPLNSEPDPQVEAALAASMGRLKRRCDEAKTNQTRPLHQAKPDHLSPSKAPTDSGETTTAEPPAVLEPLKSQPSLEWLERLKGTTYQKTRCGRYTVSAARVDSLWLFSAFYGSKVLGQAQGTAEAARAIAEAHARSWK